MTYSDTSREISPTFSRMNSASRLRHVSCNTAYYEEAFSISTPMICPVVRAQTPGRNAVQNPLVDI